MKQQGQLFKFGPTQNTCEQCRSFEEDSTGVVETGRCNRFGHIVPRSVVRICFQCREPANTTEGDQPA